MGEGYSGERKVYFAKTKEEEGTSRDLHTEEPSLVNPLPPTCKEKKKKKWGRGVITRGLEPKETSKSVHSGPIPLAPLPQTKLSQFQLYWYLWLANALLCGISRALQVAEQHPCSVPTRGQ